MSHDTHPPLAASPPTPTPQLSLDAHLDMLRGVTRQLATASDPETVLQRTRPHRVAIPHANVPNMVAQILSAIAAQQINIADMLNHSRGEISYTLVDLDAAPNDATLARIRDIEGILSARVLPILEQEH